MENLISGKSVAEIDRLSQSMYKIPSLVLMEQAGLKAWQIIKEEIDFENPLVIVAGGGNNGGDGLVIAREAINDGVKDILVILCGNTISPSCKVERDIIDSYGIPTVEALEISLNDEIVQAIGSASYIVDSITGTGLNSELRDVPLALVTAINESSAKVFSIDIPSGLSDSVEVSSLSIVANYTICMGPLKSLYYNPTIHIRCGIIKKINPSFPNYLINSVKPTAFLANDEEPLLTPLNNDAYKKSRGHLAIFGGSLKYTGAVRLASRSAFFSRVGLVSALCDDEIYPIVASESPSVIVHPSNSVEIMDSYNAILAGPGWGFDREDQLEGLLKSLKPLVIDADGIKAFSKLYSQGKTSEHGTIILTPHIGELRVLCNAIYPDYGAIPGKDDTPEDFLNLLTSLSVKTGAIIVCKSEITFLATPARKPMAVSGDNPSLGVAGSGDVLAGCIAGLLAGGLSPFKSALYGVLWHQEAGREAHRKYGYYDSELLIKVLGKVIAQ